MAKVLMIHPDKCTGCRNCELACSFEHERRFRPGASRVQAFTWEREGISVPMMCQQCDEASCVKVCPTAALSRARGASVVAYEKAKCIGCRMCTMACPFGSITYDAATAAVLKCDTCGGDPACAKACPTHAIAFVDDSISTRARKKSVAAKFKSAFEEA